MEPFKALLSHGSHLSPSSSKIAKRQCWAPTSIGREPVGSASVHPPPSLAGVSRSSVLLEPIRGALSWGSLGAPGWLPAPLPVLALPASALGAVACEHSGRAAPDRQTDRPFSSPPLALLPPAGLRGRLGLSLQLIGRPPPHSLNKQGDSNRRCYPSAHDPSAVQKSADHLRARTPSRQLFFPNEAISCHYM